MYGRGSTRHRRVHDAWQFGSAMSPELAARIGVDRMMQPDHHVVPLSAGTGWMRAQIVSGDPPAPGALLFVEDRGLFEVTRVDAWTSADGEGSRVFVLLSAILLGDDASAHR